ncbi:hypothetical protein ACT4R9_06500 [Ornithobacterium rhinotracheale]|uniref:hypothetical protein n=1 Tax=Ornithobacterium rhinotracheale TaxID=28251 RepID=UPI003FCFB62A
MKIHNNIKQIICVYFLFWAGLQNLFAVSNVSLSADIYTNIEIKKLAKAVGESQPKEYSHTTKNRQRH